MKGEGLSLAPWAPIALVVLFLFGPTAAGVVLILGVVATVAFRYGAEKATEPSDEEVEAWVSQWRNRPKRDDDTW